MNHMMRGLTSRKIKFILLTCAILILTLSFTVVASAAGNAKIRKTTYRGKKGYYYCVDGKVRTSFTGIYKYRGTQWLIKKGRAATGYSGIYKYRKTRYLIKKGKVYKKFSGTWRWKGKTYTIRKGVVVAVKSSPSKNASSKTTSAKGSATVYEPVQGGYYYDHLSSKLKKVYREFYQQALDGEKLSTSVVGITQDEVDRAYNSMYYDHPEIFWLSSKVSKRKRASMKTKIEKAADKIIRSIPSGAGEYEKIRYIYEYIVNHTSYESDSKHNQDIQSVLIYHSSVCAGYARTFQYLMNRMGYYCITVCGVSGGTSHAWNVVRIDGDYYYVDTTFGDKNGDRIDYSFLCFNDSDLEKIGGYSEAPASIPSCKSTRYNYFRLNNLYFESFSEELAEKALKKAAKSGKKTCEMRFGSESECEKAKNALLNGTILQELGYHSYSVDTYLNTLIFVR